MCFKLKIKVSYTNLYKDYKIRIFFFNIKKNQIKNIE